METNGEHIIESLTADYKGMTAEQSNQLLDELLQLLVVSLKEKIKVAIYLAHCC